MLQLPVGVTAVTDSQQFGGVTKEDFGRCYTLCLSSEIEAMFHVPSFLFICRLS
jgi:hypothetical protein